jgi:5-methylcytosine-specific restriction endonuclease McrA
MTNQEIRRVISRGDFTNLLDDIANSKVPPYCSLKAAFEEARLRIDPDQYQEYYLRFFTLQSCNVSDFGTPSIQDQTLATMKRLNKESKTPDGTSRVREYERRLKNALEIVLQVFPDCNNLFQRPISLYSLEGNEQMTRVWSKSSRINLNIWDCIMFVFATADKSTVIENATYVHDAFVDIMQTSEVFSQRKMNKKDTSQRIVELQSVISHLDKPFKDRPLYGVERYEIIKQWRASNKPCALCKQPLSNFDEFCHVDHTKSRAYGGRTQEENLQVTHKICNLKKGSRSEY